MPAERRILKKATFEILSAPVFWGAVVVTISSVAIPMGLTALKPVLLALTSSQRSSNKLIGDTREVWTRQLEDPAACWIFKFKE